MGPRSLSFSGKRILRGALCLLAIFLFCLSYWIHRYFGQLDVNQIAYHLNFGVDIVRSSDPVFTRRFVRWCVLAPCIFLALLLAAERRLLGALLRQPRAWRPALCRLYRQLPNVLLAAAAGFWLWDVSALKYVGANFGPDYFGANYVQPGSVQLAEREAKNLILIYVESLETGYADRAAFGRDLIAPLTGLHGASFAAYEQAPGTGWTIAALVATQCGVPLERVTIFDGNTQGQMMDSFLGKAVCLPDLLAQRGYRNVFMGGASARFAGKDKFLRQHHYHEVYGKDEWLRRGASESAMNGWGLYDADLFREARAKLRQLAASKQRFNLSLLTVDTHEPGGPRSAHCARAGYAAGFEGIVSCTAAEVADFVRFAREQGYLENTNIVIMGDHLARKNPLSAQLESLPRRAIFNRFIARDAPAPVRGQLLHFDLLPTILEFAGYAVPGGRLGLGYSGFSRHAQPPPGRLREMERDLLNRSDQYLALWAPD
ncbi:sulfatase-like hydrolase/transferase [Massilia sp. SM-13]|uniref:sulfatase-like hydrolase/transferase n=1 Tax=Pseudoduganella rhizocola TaxID=3382643 RepID=UPI0038B54B27